MTPLDRARAALMRGISCFPIPYGSKTPVVSWKRYQDRLPTEDEIQAWFRDGQPSNLGLITGAISNVVVLDADTPPAMRYVTSCLPYTPWQTRTARGGHFWFTHPGVPVANRGTDLHTAHGPLPVHVRGDGGYVLSPGSRHPSGTPYYACGDWCAPRLSLPLFAPSWITSPEAAREKSPRVTPAAACSAEDFLRLRAARYLAAVPIPQIGAGSDHATLKAACRLVRGFGLSPFVAVELLWDWCGNRDGWTREWVETKVLNAAKYGREAIGGLR